jgi:hypothetical protein
VLTNITKEAKWQNYNNQVLNLDKNCLEYSKKKTGKVPPNDEILLMNHNNEVRDSLV